MGKVTAFEAKTRFGELLDRVLADGKRSSSLATTGRSPGSCRKARRGSTRFVAPFRGCGSSTDRIRRTVQGEAVGP